MVEKENNNSNKVGLDKQINNAIFGKNIRSSDIGDQLRKLQIDIIRLSHYTYQRVDGFPRRRKDSVGIGNDIVVNTNELLKLAIRAQTYNPMLDREQLLREIVVLTRFIGVLAQMSFAEKYIAENNLAAWTKKLGRIEACAVGLASWHEQAKKRG